MSYILFVLNILFFLLMIYFLAPLRWSRKSDRASITGFTALALTFAGNAAYMYIATVAVR